jgi:hypothetical protein
MAFLRRHTGLKNEPGKDERTNYELLLRFHHRYFWSAYFHGISPLAIEACPTPFSQGRNFVA